MWDEMRRYGRAKKVRNLKSKRCHYGFILWNNTINSTVSCAFSMGSNHRGLPQPLVISSYIRSFSSLWQQYTSHSTRWALVHSNTFRKGCCCINSMRSDSQAVQRFFFVPSIFPRLLLLAFSFSMYHSSIYTRYYHVPGMFCFRFFFLCSRIHFSAILMVWLECSPHWAGHRFPLEYISYNRHFRPKYVPDPYAVRAGPAAKSLPER